MEVARGGQTVKDYEKSYIYIYIYIYIYSRRQAEGNKNSSATIGHHATINRI